MKLFSGNSWKVRQEKIIEAIIDTYGKKYFERKKRTILEVGCGYGHIGLYFEETFSAKVTYSEARIKYLDYIKETRPNSTVIQADLDNGWPFKPEYDLILHLGLLYHLINPRKSLIETCKGTKKHLFLETEWFDSDNPYLMLCRVDAEENKYNEGVNIIGCRPSYAMIEKVFDERNMKFGMIMSSKYNSIYHKYDDKMENTNKICKGNIDYSNGKKGKGGYDYRGMWFVEKE